MPDDDKTYRVRAVPLLGQAAAGVAERLEAQLNLFDGQGYGIERIFQLDDGFLVIAVDGMEEDEEDDDDDD